jgi:hypothetical protein
MANANATPSKSRFSRAGVVMWTYLDYEQRLSEPRP